MQTINLSNFPCLSKELHLQRLNNLAEIQDNLMPHQVAVATGCSHEEALAVLLLLSKHSLAEALLVVYHNEHLIDSPPILARSIFEGLPPLPFICDICQQEITSSDELSYDFLFRVLEKANFVGS
jgi:hypothetical protein